MFTSRSSSGKSKYVYCHEEKVGQVGRSKREKERREGGGERKEGEGRKDENVCVVALLSSCSREGSFEH